MGETPDRNTSPYRPPRPTREFHVREEARRRYRLDHALFALNGDMILADLDGARRLADDMNASRDLVTHPDQAVRAGDLNAMGLIDEIMHYVVGLYRHEFGQEQFRNAMDAVSAEIGEESLHTCLRRFSELFPPTPVYSGEQELDDYLEGTWGGRSGWEIALEELLMLGLENGNPAFGPCDELFDDTELTTETSYQAVLDALARHFRAQPGFGPDNEPLVDMLQAPARLFPDSLERQLAYIRERWGILLGEFLFRLLRGLDYLREENRARFAGPGPSRIYRYSGADPERFSPDRDWMPNVVMIAKSTLVWLDQLSKSYKREVRRLDQIPEEEIDRLARAGINALWLIGLWERSAASRRIKHIGGNPEAEASAYALYDYDIAGALGGWEALGVLRDRCAARGIRLASDMVPNHTGIDGRWVIEHPDWFVQLPQPPFPGYSFEGENLSHHPDVGVYLEDHYYDRSDAAVVFRRTDFRSGDTRFIYHGNDGTSMPWNDTAQLNFLNAEVREAVIQTILHVARNFPIIRFDAAMTLAKKHIQRLWFPEPGAGGDIASRAEHGLTREQLDELMPQEFWREVVDRVAAEVPDTLLLAEAFWMMEGYFVRTLGMHRVYNSAFMNMLKNQDNAKYRQTIKNTIEFDKDILKRFVNFMNNPDEDTAVAQFGKGDKYFGVMTMMLTMPGLPMIGHGQIEGFTEKYGMEYRKAYWDETPDQELMDRHEREIFPLMRRRYLFSSVENFLLYDLYSEGGSVNENAFVYSNQCGGERSLVMYNNAYERAWGWIRHSAGYVEKLDGGRKEHRRRELADALGLHAEHGYYCVFRDHAKGLWFIRRSIELHERGLYVDLGGYQCQVFMDIYEVRDNEFGHYAQLADELAGSGVPNLEEALKEIALKPLLDLWSTLANSNTYYLLGQALSGSHTPETEFIERLVTGYGRFLRLGNDFRAASQPESAALESLTARIAAAVRIPYLDLKAFGGDVARYRRAVAFYHNGVRDRADRRDLLVTWMLMAPLGAVYPGGSAVADDWSLARRAERAFQAESIDTPWPRLLRVLLTHGSWWTEAQTADELLDLLFRDAEVTAYLGFNEYEETVWFIQERFEELVWWLFTVALIEQCRDGIATGTSADASVCEHVVALHGLAEELIEAARASEYKVERLIAAVKPQAPRAGAKKTKRGKAGSSKGKKGEQ
jgi:glycosidase